MSLQAEAEVTHTSDPIEAAIRAGQHRDALSMCCREHGRSLGRLCMALLGSQAEADEAVQEVLLAAHASMQAYRGDGSIRAWLFGIARHLCARRLETRTRQARRLALVHDADRDAGMPEDIVETRRRATRVRAALEELKPSEREALLLHYESGLSFAEVGLATGLDEAAARKRASRALGRLREIFGREGAR